MILLMPGENTQKKKNEREREKESEREKAHGERARDSLVDCEVFHGL